jgi:hypothetical protein
MATIISDTGLSLGDVVAARVKATNSNGDGAYSALSTSAATIETITSQIVDLALDSASSDKNQITITWTALTGNGKGGNNVAISNYEVYFAEGTDTLASVATPSTATYVKATLTPGNTYHFQVRGVNKYGNGAFSSKLTVVAAQKPDKPDAPTVTLIDKQVKIAFTTPASYSLTVSKYQIILIDKDGAYVEVTSLCDGAESTIASQKYCLIAMTSLTETPLSLPFEASI